MFKVGMSIAILGILGVVGLYYFGGYSSFDPTAKGRAAKAAISPGMTWTQVVSAAGEPGKYVMAHKEKHKIAGQDVEEIVWGNPVEFATDLISNDLAAKQLADGFALRYFFGHQVAFDVICDGTGTVTDIVDLKTMADLLQTRKP